MIFEKNYARFYEKIIILGTSDAWYESFVPSAKQTSVLYCRLMDFKMQH